MPRKRIEDGPNELRIVREARRLSQMQAATLVGVSRPMWSSWECRARQMTITQLNEVQAKLTPPLSDAEVEKIRKWWTKPQKAAEIPVEESVPVEVEKAPEKKAGRKKKTEAKPKASSKKGVRKKSEAKKQAKGAQKKAGSSSDKTVAA